MYKTIIIYHIIFFLCYAASAQPYIEGGKTRHRFAQSTFGIEQRTFFGASSSASINSSGQIETFKIPNHTESRIVIGGTHFWGHSDFYISIPVLSFGNSGFSGRVETGAKYYHWKIQNNKIRPYIGASWLPMRYEQGEGTRHVRSRFPVIAGFTFNSKEHLLELGFGYNYNNRFNYYISPINSTTVTTKPFWLSISYKLMLESTLSAEKDWQSGRTKKLTDTLTVLNRLNGFTFAVGLSSAFFLKSSPHLAQVAPYADNHKSVPIFPEFGLGYYFHKPDIQLNLAYRSMSSELNAYDFFQRINIKALTLEVYKFLFDYHGFVPFFGLSISQEWLTINEKNVQSTERKNENGFFPGLTLGWDIRPNRLQSWYLRTNLRYFPMQNVEMNTGKNQPFDRLEFNFIQLVIFPERVLKFR